MARKRTRMQKIRDIIRLRHQTQMAERKIGRARPVSRTVVTRTLAQFRISGLTAQAIEGMGDSELEQRLWQKDRLVDSPRYQALEKRFPTMLPELKKKGVTLEWLWEQTRGGHPE